MRIPEWASNARILAVRYEEIERLEQIANYYQANVLILYMVPEISNGWCPQGSYEQIADFITRAHKYGLKVLTYFDSVTVEEEFYQGEHRDWVQRTPEGKPQHFQPPHIPKHRYCNCINSPWRNYLLKITEKAAQLGADGILFDNPGYYEFFGPSCFCKYCQEKFRREKGRDIYKVSKKEQRLWAHNQMGVFLKDAYCVFQMVNPYKEIVVTANYSGSKFQNMKSLAQGENVLFHEVFSLTRKELLLAIRNDRKVGDNKPLWIIKTGLVREKEGYSVDNVSEYELFIAEAVAYGARPVLWSAPPSMNPKKPGFTFPSLYEIPEFSEMVSTYYSFIKKYENYLYSDISSSFEVETEPQVLTIGYRKNSNFVLHLINYQKEVIKNLKVLIKDRKIKNIKFASPENSKEIKLPILKNGDRFCQLPRLRKWAILIGSYS